MVQRELILERLRSAARRLRWQRAVREAGRFACALLGLLLLYQALRLAIGSEPVMAGLLPLFVMLALVALGATAWRLQRGTTLAQAASAVDARADLKDELKSAYWFVEHRTADPLVERLLSRAGDTARRLNPQALFPFAMPLSWVAALALALLAGTLATIAPRSTAVDATAGQAASASLRSAPAREPEAAVAAAQPDRAQDGQHAAGARSPVTDWARAAELVRALEASEEADALEQAVKARDTRRASDLLGALQRKHRPPPTGSAARPDGEQMSAEVAAGILARLQTLLESDENAQPPRSSAARAQGEHAARLTQDEPGPASQRNTDTRHSGAEAQFNSLLRSISRSSVGGEAIAGEGQMGRGTGRSNVTGGAMGRRVGVSQAGAGDGTGANADPSGDSDSEPVLGARTQRLSAQLQRVGVEGREAPDASEESALESFYAATQAQAAQLDYSTPSVTTQRSAEHVVGAAEIPFAYRGPVKEYFLRQHRREK